MISHSLTIPQYKFDGTYDYINNLDEFDCVAPIVDIRDSIVKIENNNSNAEEMFGLDFIYFLNYRAMLGIKCQQ